MPPSSPRRARLLPPEATTFWRKDLEGPSGPDCYLYPFFTKCTPIFYFFCNSSSVTLRNFTNFVTILIFLPQGYESLRIMYLLFFSFRRSYGNSRIVQKHLLSISVTLRNFMDRVSLLPFDFRHVSGLHILCNKGCQVS